MGEHTPHRPEQSSLPQHTRGRKRERPFRDYLYQGFLNGDPYTHGANLNGIEKLVDDTRDQGNFIHISRGVPEVHPQVIKRLSGVSAALVAEKIEVLRDMRNAKGDLLVEALEYRQRNSKPRPEADEMTISRRAMKAVEMLEGMLGLREMLA